MDIAVGQDGSLRVLACPTVGPEFDAGVSRLNEGFGRAQKISQFKEGLGERRVLARFRACRQRRN
jgi:hypothetical protein